MHNKYLLTHEWKILEDRWDPSRQEGSESLFSLGNGYMGQRANFEEQYSGKHLQGSYIAGVYYPDKTRVGWWKNGYPEYFAKVLNSVNWIGIKVEVNGTKLDLSQLKVLDFYRELNMQEGYLLRRFKVEIKEGQSLEVEALRFISMKRKEIGAIRYSITPIGFSPTLKFQPYLDFDVINSDSNYDEKFWDSISENAGSQKAVISAKTKKLDFHVAASMRYELYINKEHFTLYPEIEKREKYAANSFEVAAKDGETYQLYKYAAITSSLNHSKDQIIPVADKLASDAMRDGFDALLNEQKADWKERWENCDIRIEGDASAQQGIRFNIFQLTQTYTGEDARLNIGPKGFTGEKYGGSTYWDTEAYCLPFYMASAPKQVARNLLVYRHNHLSKAIENAEKLGFKNGAALYPMVTMNGEECHNEWEITFEEIHRNGAIAFAIYNYARYYGDESYIKEYGLEVLIGIARFWAQRFNWSGSKNQFVMLGVTGPNEYENNVNNNWYTSYIARWTIQYTAGLIKKFGNQENKQTAFILEKTNFQKNELEEWNHIAENVYLPEDKSLGVFLQQESFLDKELIKADDLDDSERPINQYWSWDRILRSCFIKQADVLQGLYLFEDQFSKEEIERNFDFYEPMTVHESSLSPCVHVILAAYLDKMETAYSLYLRTSRLDLDDYNHEIDEGLHITSMAGTWMSVVEGFGGMRVKDDHLHFNPRLPKSWEKLSFKINFRGQRIELNFEKDDFSIFNHSDKLIELTVSGQSLQVPASSILENSYA